MEYILKHHKIKFYELDHPLVADIKYSNVKWKRIKDPDGDSFWRGLALTRLKRLRNHDS